MKYNEKTLQAVKDYNEHISFLQGCLETFKLSSDHLDVRELQCLKDKLWIFYSQKNKNTTLKLREEVYDNYTEELYCLSGKGQM